MKLINKFTIWYLIITFAVLGIGGLIVFNNVQSEVDIEEARELHTWIDNAAAQLRKGKAVKQLHKDQIEVRVLDTDSPEIPFTSYDTLALHEQLQRMERHMKVKASYKINDRHYLISAYDVMVEPDDITDAVTNSFIWIFGLLIVFVGILGRWISNKILSPFNRTLTSIQSFRVNQNKPIAPNETGTREFVDLNLFLQQMTGKALDDYRSLKEFTENASHEIQTPLAVIRGKLELLMNTSITGDQAELIMGAHKSVEKLSKVSQSLSLLTKLSNQEFESESVDFSKLLKNNLSLFEDLMRMKSLKVSSEIEDEIKVQINPMLAELLTNNLLSNAIRHNVAEGRVIVTLNAKGLTIENTGIPLQFPAHQLFERFKKGNQSNDSTGLGLSIVKQICDMSQFKVEYRYENGLHVIQLNFTNT
jgi:signal transduction histidine kinase